MQGTKEELTPNGAWTAFPLSPKDDSPHADYFMVFSGENWPDQKMRQCIQSCLDCHSICLETLAYCLKKGDKHSGATHIQSLLDCAEICQVNANFMLRNSSFHHQVRLICALICERCADDWDENFEDAEMRTCAKVCRTCAQICSQSNGR